MQQYKLNFSFSIVDETKSYQTESVMSCSVSEKLPVDVDPEVYLKQRLAEEVKRQFKNLTIEIDNKTENFDPLGE